MLGVINRMAKKFNYKLPSMVALTLVGSAVTAHQVQAAETTQDQTTNKNVLDSNKVKATTEQAKAEVKIQRKTFLALKYIKTLLLSNEKQQITKQAMLK